MKVGFVGNWGFLTGLAMQAEREGHRSIMFTDNPELALVGEGLVELGESASSTIKQSDFVIFESNLWYERAETAREKFGKPTLGATALGQALGKKDYREALLKSLTGDFNPGLEPNLAIEGWFNGKDFLEAVVSFTQPHFMSGDVGPWVGCAGVTLHPHHLHDEVGNNLTKLVEVLRKVDYRGPVKLYLQNKTWVSLHTGFSYHDLDALSELVKGSFVEALRDVATGQTNPLTLRDAWSAAVRVSVPAYPYLQIEHEPIRQPIGGLDETNERHVRLLHASRDKANGDTLALRNGVACAVTSRGDEPRECRRRILRTLRNLQVPDAQYRNDVGVGVEERVTEMRKEGLIT